MPIWTKNTLQNRSMDILLFDEFSNHCLANAVEPIRAANTLSDQTLYSWRFLSLDGGAIQSSSGLRVDTEMVRDSDRQANYLMVISSYGHHALCTPSNLAKLRGHAARCQTVVGLDTGAWLLASAGLLKGKKATVHSDLFEAFSEQFVYVNFAQDRFVEDDNVITCGGAMAAFDMGLHLIGQHHGEALRLDVATLFLQHAEVSSGDLYKRRINSPLIARALKLMEDNLEEPIEVRALADHLACSGKELQRRFYARFGATPGQVYRHKRLMLARHLMQENMLSVSEISVRCGYNNASAMTRAFKRQFGKPPSYFRR